MADIDFNITGTIGNGAVTNSKLSNMDSQRIKGRATAGSGSPEDLTANQVSTILDGATDPFLRTSDANFDPAGSAAAAQAASQPLDSDLTAIAGLSPSNDDVIQRKAGAWTNRTLAQLAADLAATSGVAQRTGATIAFDSPAIYNTPTSPSGAAVSLDLTGAVVGTEVVAFFNHATEPSWPSGVTAVGSWNNSALNVVRFLYQDSSNISAVIVSDAAPSNGDVWTPIRKTTATVRSSTTVLAADPDLKLTMAANEKFNTRWKIAFVTGATGDFKYRIVGPSSPTLIRGLARVTQTSGTAPAARVLTAYDSADQTITAAAGFTGFIEIDLYVENGATPGDLEFQWAQNTSDATSTTVSRGAYLEYLETV